MLLTVLALATINIRRVFICVYFCFVRLRYFC